MIKKKILKLLGIKTRGFEFVERVMWDIVDERNHYTLPVRGTDGSAGYDFVLPVDVYLEPNEVVCIPSGIKAYMKKDEVLKIYARSSTGIKLRVTLPNKTGIIDHDYYNNPKNEGEIGLSLVNEGNEPIKIEAGERVAQGIFVKYLTTDEDKPKSKVRLGGFGSTGRKK